MKLKHCKYADHDLPLTEFTSTRARFCISCTRLRLIELQQKRQQKYIDRLTTKKQKTKTVMSVADLKNKVQRVFNAWIRERDKDLPCISCQKWSDKFDAGHFINQGSSGVLRYHEENVHKQCSFSCNHNLSGNKIEYRIALVKKIGEERVRWLEDHRNDVKKWTREELEELLTKYK